MKLTRMVKKPKVRLINEFTKSISDLNSIDRDDQNIPNNNGLFEQYLDRCETVWPKEMESLTHKRKNI
jgi:hypothetical protein